MIDNEVTHTPWGARRQTAQFGPAVTPATMPPTGRYLEGLVGARFFIGG
jgi:hypothetical protein